LGFHQKPLFFNGSRDFFTKETYQKVPKDNSLGLSYTPPFRQSLFPILSLATHSLFQKRIEGKKEGKEKRKNVRDIYHVYPI
jgi:hypothetical protein